MQFYQQVSVRNVGWNVGWRDLIFTGFFVALSGDDVIRRDRLVEDFLLFIF
jgi:hypothetical protein